MRRILGEPWQDLAEVGLNNAILSRSTISSNSLTAISGVKSLRNTLRSSASPAAAATLNS